MWAGSVCTTREYPLSALQLLRWRHPEWWTVVISAMAWALLLATHALGGEAPHGQPDGAGAIWAWFLELLDWLLMVLAMMVPLVLFSIRLTAARSLWRRRHRGIAAFLMGYISCWLVIGGIVAALTTALEAERWLHLLPWLGALGFAVAAVWQLAPWRVSALLACHRTMPLAPRGWRADRDCLRFGWLTGARCIVSCWALMLACLLAGHDLAAMVCASGLALAERYLVVYRPGQRVLFSPLLAAACVYGLLCVS